MITKYFCNYSYNSLEAPTSINGELSLCNSRPQTRKQSVAHTTQSPAIFLTSFVKFNKGYIDVISTQKAVNTKIEDNYDEPELSDSEF